SFRVTLAGRSSIEMVGGAFPTTMVVDVDEVVVLELVVEVVGKVVVVELVVVVGRVVLVVVVVGRGGVGEGEGREVVGGGVGGGEEVLEVVGRVVEVEEEVLEVVGRVVVVEDEVLEVVGRVVVVDVLVEAVNVAAAATASRRPKPLASSKPGAPMSTAPRVSAACTSAGVSVGS